MLRKNFDDLDTNGQKGDWCFFNDAEIIVVRFGDDVHDIALCYIKPQKHIAVGTVPHPVWDWNGSHEAPTLSPSILVRGEKGQPDKWHGYLQDGKLITV